MQKTLGFSNLCAFFANVISRKRRATQRKKLQSSVSQVKRNPHAKFQALSRKFFFHPNSHLGGFSTDLFKSARTTTIHPGIFRGQALWADSVSPRMNTIASRDQFKPIRIGENLVVNYY